MGCRSGVHSLTTRSDEGPRSQQPVSNKMILIREDFIRRRCLPLAAGIAVVIFSTPSVWAATAADAAAPASEEDLLQQVIVTGTRQIGIVAAESAAPIQIVAG